MKKKLLILLSLIFVFIICEKKVEANEKELLKFLRDLHGVEYKIKDYANDFEGYSADTDKFAREFYEDFLQGKVEFIVPEHRTDNINDSKFQEYLNKFPSFYFVRASVLGNEKDFMIVDQEYPHYNFKVYEVNFDNNKSNDKENIFYSGGYWNDDGVSGYSMYNILNKNNDKIDPYYKYKGYLDSVGVHSEYKGKEKKRTKNYTGIIKYEGTYYIYEILDWNSMIIIDFYCWNKKLNRVSCLLDYTIELEGNQDE